MRKLFYTIMLLAFCVAPAQVQGAPRQIQLVWDAPTTNEDGSCLDDLSFYKVYHTSASGSYTDFWTTAVTDPALSCVDSGVDAGTGCGNIAVCTFNTPVIGVGTWYFNVTANDFANNESVYSNEATKEIVDDVPASGCTNLIAQEVQ